MNLHGKTALVTGSTSGIGLGIAKVRGGAQLVLNGFGDSTPGLKSPRWLRSPAIDADLRRRADRRR